MRSAGRCLGGTREGTWHLGHRRLARRRCTASEPVCCRNVAAFWAPSASAAACGTLLSPQVLGGEEVLSLPPKTEEEVAVVLTAEEQVGRGG